MTPAARVQTAIEILDEILTGRPAEQALTGWARRSRFAGSKDRAAVRDHVFDALRARRSLSALGGAMTGRGLMLGLCRRDGPDPQELFTGLRYAPAPVEDHETPTPPVSDAERLDIPDWIWPDFSDSLGAATEAAAVALQSRAPVHLRVNLTKSDPATAIDVLAREGIEAQPHPACETALEIRDGARKLRNCAAYRDGFVELQDAASQAIALAVPVQSAQRVLDYCAGGGGKALALAARGATVFAHDLNVQRMKDLPDRARRAGARIDMLDGAQVRAKAPFDVVMIDVPCSGSGAWRRAPEGKWSLTPDMLDDVTRVQAQILDETCALVAPSGVLAYATCSVLRRENDAQIDAFLARHPDWVCTWRQSWSLTDGTDGFFSAHLTRRDADR
jgi:16S rRNA (cytosine967-C5)-methyltransferase